VGIGLLAGGLRGIKGFNDEKLAMIYTIRR